MDMEDDVGEALAIFTAECRSVLPRIHKTRRRNVGGVGNDDDVGIDPPATTTTATNNVFLKTWEKFSQVHKSSPSRLNNNISNRCNREFRRKGISEKKGSSEKKEWLKLKPKGQVNRISESAVIVGRGLFHLLGIFLKTLELILLLMVSLVVFYCVIVLHKPTQSIISRNTQDLIYPLMRGLRLITLPIIRSFPKLTEIYEESCLITNPSYFSMHRLQCWPCEEAKQVIHLTGFSNFSSVIHYGGIPFVVKNGSGSPSESQPSRIERIYLENSELLSSVTLGSNVNGIHAFGDIFPMNHTNAFDRHENLCIVWKINKVAHTRILRKYFSKPSFIPAKTEVSIQHFLFLDNLKSPAYSLPFTEFANVFLHQAGGSRHVVLIPTEKCQGACKVLSVVLQNGDVLFYNWLYWRPRSVPFQSSSLNSREGTQSPSVTYLGSFY